MVWLCGRPPRCTAILNTPVDQMRTRMTMFPPIQLRTDDADYQHRYGDAAGLIATSDAAASSAIRQWQDSARHGDVGKETELRIAAVCHLFPTISSSAVKSGERIERVWRDLPMLHTHTGVAVFLRVVRNRNWPRRGSASKRPPVPAGTRGDAGAGRVKRRCRRWTRTAHCRRGDEGEYEWLRDRSSAPGAQ